MQCFANAKMEIVVLKSISNLAEILLVLSKQISNISLPVGPVARVMLLACVTQPFLLVIVLDQK